MTVERKQSMAREKAKRKSKIVAGDKAKDDDYREIQVQWLKSKLMMEAREKVENGV